MPSEGQSPFHAQPEGLQLAGEFVPQDRGRILKGAENSEVKLKRELQGWKCQPGGNSRGAPPSHQNVSEFKRSRRAKFHLILSLLKQKINNPAVGAGSPLDPQRETSPKVSTLLRGKMLQQPPKATTEPQQAKTTGASVQWKVLFKNTQNSQVHRESTQASPACWF